MANGQIEPVEILKNELIWLPLSGGILMRIPFAHAVKICVLCAAVSLPCLAEAPPELNDQSFRKWIDFVRPNAEESKWRQVGWRTALWPAVQEARELQRPLLLWTMNGHPCGHT